MTRQQAEAYAEHGIENERLQAEVARLRAALEAQQAVEDHELECVFCLHQEDCNERAKLAADAGVARSDILGE